jgi:hypothetical protein
MPMILKNRPDSFAFHLVAGVTCVPLMKVIEQLSKQLRRERAQHQYNMAEKEKCTTRAAEARYELARRDKAAAFASAPNPGQPALMCTPK